MFDIINKLSNVDALSGFIKPYSDRLTKLNQLAPVLDRLLDVSIAANDAESISDPVLVIPWEEWEDWVKPFKEMQSQTGPSIIFTDPTSEQATVLSISTQDLDFDAPVLIGYSYISDNAGGYDRRSRSFIEAYRVLDDDEQPIVNVYWDGRQLKTAKYGGDEVQVILPNFIIQLQDQISSYELSLDAIKMTIKNRELNASDFSSHVKSLYAGLRSGSLELFQNLTSSLSVHDVSSVVGVIRNYMNPKGIEVQNDGSVHFPETAGTKEFSFGAVIASTVSGLVTMLGAVITTVCAPIGIALTGLGTIASAATKAISSAVNESTIVNINPDSENVDIAVKLKQASYAWNDPVEALYHHTIRDILAPSGFQPHKYELPGISGYLWASNYDGSQTSAIRATMVHESYLSCRGYMEHKDLYNLIQQYFFITRTQYEYSGGAGHATVRISPKEEADLYTFLNAWYKKLIPIDYSQLSYISNDEKNLIYQKAVLTDSVAITLLYAIFNKSDGISDYTDVTVAINSHHPFPESTEYLYNVFRIAIQFMCDPFHDTFNSYPMVTWDPNYISWNYNPNISDPVYTTYNETQMSKISSAIDERGFVDASFARTILDNILLISTDYMTLHDLVEDEDVDGSFQFYPVEQRFDFRMRPPKWTRRSIIFNLVLTGVVIAAIATISTIAFIKINKWKKVKQLQTQTETEAAWDRCKADPSEANLKAYKKAALKQNTIGRLYGCSKVSNTNYWAATEQSIATPSNIQEDINNAIPDIDNSCVELIRLIRGE